MTASRTDEAARGSSVNRAEQLLMDPKVREGFAKLAPLGLTFDAWMYFTQLGELVDLARAFPETQIVLNHVVGAIGIGPYAGKRDEVFAEWKSKIAELGRCPNMHVKLGGLGMRLFGFDVHTGPIAPSSEQLATAWRPYIEACIEAFGPERAMLESNFPVDNGTGGYHAFCNALKPFPARPAAPHKNPQLSAPPCPSRRLAPA